MKAAKFRYLFQFSLSPQPPDVHFYPPQVNETSRSPLDNGNGVWRGWVAMADGVENHVVGRRSVAL